MDSDDSGSLNRALADSARLLSVNAGRAGRFSTLASKIQRIADSQLAQSVTEPIDCKAGCAHCCHRLVDATLPEAIAIAEFVVDNFGPSEVIALQDRIQTYHDAADAHFRGEVEKFRDPCPFLVNDLCSVYDRRPLSCRGIFSPDANLCRRWEQREINPPMYPGPIALMKAYSQGIVEGYQEAVQPSGTFNLAGAVSVILEQGPAAYYRQNVPAPVERHVVVSPNYDSVTIPSADFAQLLQKPHFEELWHSATSGDQKSVELWVTKFDDPVLTLFSKLTLPSFYESQDDLDNNWARMLAGLEDFENASLNPRDTYERLPLLRTFYWPYSGKNVRPIFERLMRKIHQDVTNKAYPRLCEPFRSQRRPGKFRVGYASSSLTGFSGSRWATGWLAGHGSDFETFAFNLAPEEDSYSNLWRRLSDHYFRLPIPSAAAAELIRSFELDALIYTDLGLGKFDHQLSTFRLARKQFTSYGHPVTTGSPAIDGFLSSALMEPEGGQAHYSETVTCLPRSGLCYPKTIQNPADVDPRQYGLPETGYYFEAQMPSKCLPEYDWLYRRISEESGKPIAFLSPHSEVDLDKMTRRLKDAGVNAVMIPRTPVREYLGLVAKADTMLDTPAWNGGHTTIDALALGKPVVTVPGEFMRGRHSLAFNTIAGAPELVASSLEDYVSLALDRDRQLNGIRNLSPENLFNDTAASEALNRFLLDGFEG